jgi:hypothetical protein
MAPARSTRVPWLIAAVLALVLIATAVVDMRRASARTPAAGPTRFTIAPPENARFEVRPLEERAAPRRWQSRPMASTSSSSLESGRRIGSGGANRRRHGDAD